MDKQRYIEQILAESSLHWSRLPVRGGGPFTYEDGVQACDVGANLHKGEKAHSLWVSDTEEPLAILMTNERVVTGWICEQPLIACTTPESEEFRYLADNRDYTWEDVPQDEDGCTAFVEEAIKDVLIAWEEDTGLSVVEADLAEKDINSMDLGPLPLPRLGDDALPPEDDRNSEGV